MMVVAVLTLALTGCSAAWLAREGPMKKDYGVCLKHGILDAQACDGLYDSGRFPPKGSSLRAPEPVVVVAQTWNIPMEDSTSERLYGPRYRVYDPMKDYLDSRREQQIQDQERRLGDLERARQAEQFQRSMPWNQRPLR
jgi:hypothetical protein